MGCWWCSNQNIKPPLQCRRSLRIWDDLSKWIRLLMWSKDIKEIFNVDFLLLFMLLWIESKTIQILLSTGTKLDRVISSINFNIPFKVNGNGGVILCFEKSIRPFSDIASSWGISTGKHMATLSNRQVEDKGAEGGSRAKEDTEMEVFILEVSFQQHH